MRDESSGERKKFQICCLNKSYSGVFFSISKNYINLDEYSNKQAHFFSFIKFKKLFCNIKHVWKKVFPTKGIWNAYILWCLTSNITLFVVSIMMDIHMEEREKKKNERE